MMRRLLLSSVLALGASALLAALGSRGQPGGPVGAGRQPGPVFTKGQPVPVANFTGKAWVQGLVGKEDKYSCGAGSVQFAPGARTHWHTHPAGQILLVVAGTGRYQEKGQPLRVLRKGDVIKAPAGVEHWHGAAPAAALTHVAINPDLAAVPVVWGRAVTEQEYLGRP